MITYVGYWKKQDQIVLLHKSTLCTEVEFDFGVKYLQAELGPHTDFDIICELDRPYSPFEETTIEIKDFDNGATDESMAMKIVVTGLTKNQLKDKGGTVLDLGNYIYNTFGLIYEMCPEFSNHNEPKDSLTWFVSKGKFKTQKRLIDFIASRENKSSKLVELGAVRFNIRIQG
jgi:hypothetical protein